MSNVTRRTDPSPPTSALPQRATLDRLRKQAKRTLVELRRDRPDAKLADAQLSIARGHGFPSWRALKAHIDAERARTATTASELRDDTIASVLREVGDGALDKVAAALRDTPALVNAVGPHPFWGGRPQPLHVAIETNRFPMVQLLLRAGADVDGSNDGYSRWSPLLIAIAKPERGKSKRALLRRGAKIGLVEALAMGDDRRALHMLRRGKAALPDTSPNDGSLLAFARTPAAIDRLLALGVATDTRDRWGATPTESLSRSGRRGLQLVRHLAARGVTVDAEAFARIGDRHTLARMATHDPHILTRPTVVKSAVDFGHRSLASWLLDRGADVNARSTTGSIDTCLHSAAWNGDVPMVELLLARGADRTLLDEEHKGTPARWAEVSARVTANPKCLLVLDRLRRP